jgi:prepilin-type N-terminal cleavage/methylation domain-containing protein
VTKKIREYKQGFGLVEILILVAILGVIAVIAIPRFDTFRAPRNMYSVQADVKEGSDTTPAYFHYR